MEYSFENRLGRKDSAVGMLVVENLLPITKHPLLEERLGALLPIRRQPLGPLEEKMRGAVRDMLRNGQYKPTGRAKPASEYLLRAANENQFPRISPIVDTINYISLKYMVPISLWDVLLAKTAHYVFRLGKANESYIFNAAGQVIEIEDLLCGFALGPTGEIPIVSPVKDSQQTKVGDGTQTAAVAVYYPLQAGSPAHLEGILQELQELFLGHGEIPLEAVRPTIAVSRILCS